MGTLYAEVIGDPVSHSKSPLIHRFWLEKIGRAGDYRAARVSAGGLARHLESRRLDPFWRGCSITAPLKREAAALLGDPTGVCAWIGAVNCVFRGALGLVPANSDIAGIDEALTGVRLHGEKICLIGAGGAATATLCYLLGRNPAAIALIARDTVKAGQLRDRVPAVSRPLVEVVPLAEARSWIADASLIVNATPMGMDGGPAVDPILLESVAAASPGATMFDMVYAPAETPLLRTASRRGLKCISGLQMLVGQAAPAFETFFGAAAPRDHDSELIALLAR